MRTRKHGGVWVVAWFIATLLPPAAAVANSPAPTPHRMLYVATPGVRDYLEFGGHGVLVFDIDHDHKFIRRIRAAGLNAEGKPSNVKGICASASQSRFYVSTLQKLTCFDLASDKILWEKSYEGGCDRMSISPDGSTLYMPSLEGPFWNVIDAATGERLTTIQTDSGAHNTIFGPDGKHVYMAGLRSPLLSVADAKTHKVVATVGPFGNFIRPFTINARQTRVYVNENELLGFEVGDLTTGKVLHRVEVSGFDKGTPKRHGCPSHGIGLTPDESEIWLTDAVNRRLHIYDNSAELPKYKQSIELRDEPGWITFSIDGQYAYPSTGEVIDVKTRKVIAQLKDETGAAVQSEKMLEIDFADDKPARNGDQFGIGRAR